MLNLAEKCHRNWISGSVRSVVKHQSVDKMLFEQSMASKSKLLPYYGNDNITVINFSYNPRAQTTTISYLVDDISFVSNLGGGLGLALGVSTFSVMDLILERILSYI